MNTIEEALEELRRGRPVLVADDETRENEVDAIIAAELAEPQWIGWMVRHTSGYLCAPMPNEIANRLNLPLMVPNSQDPKRTAYTISVDAASGVTTGISAHDRAVTVRALADPQSKPSDLRRPGHILPLRAVSGGVRERGGHTEAAVDLCRSAGLSPVGAIGELVHDDGSLMRLSEAEEFASAQCGGLTVITIEALKSHLASVEAVSSGVRGDQPRVVHTGSAKLPTEFGEFTIHGYIDQRSGADLVALTAGHLKSEPVTVRIHSECLTGEAFHSRRCECGAQLNEALRRIHSEGGVVVYVRGHEGRGIGLLDKVAAYNLQDQGCDTVTANIELGWEADLRDYSGAAAVLQDLGVERVNLLTNNPDKAKALRDHGIEVDRTTRLLVGITPENQAYMRTKAESMGHIIDMSRLDVI